MFNPLQRLLTLTDTAVSLLLPGAVRGISPLLLPVEGNPNAQEQGRSYGSLVRQELTPEEQSAPISLCFELNLPGEAPLKSHIEQGHVLTPDDLQDYLPTQGTYDSLKGWLLSQGFTITLESRFRNTLFVTGTVAQATAALQTTFGRVATSSCYSTSALSEPVLPEGLAADVLSTADFSSTCAESIPA